jgi:hypothetical protein
MKAKKKWLAGPAIAATAFLFWRGAGDPRALSAEEPDYVTACEVVGPYAVSGTITNHGPDTYQVNGIVTFSFDRSGLQTLEVRVTGGGMVGPGMTAVVAQASPLPMNISVGISCRFVVDGSIQKVPKP